MNICFLINGMGRGGAERVISTLANHFVGHGDDVTLMTFNGSASAYPLDERIKIVKLRLSGAKKTLILSLKDNIRKRKIIRDKIREIKPDIIVAFSIKHALLAKLSSCSVPVIGSERSNPFVQRKGMKNWLIKLFSPIIDGFIFQTNGAALFYPKRVQKKGAIIPNAVTESIPEHLPDYKNRKKAICAVGRLEPVKRFDLLLLAFSEISVFYPDYSLHIYGEGKSRNELENLIRDLHLEGKAFLDGSIDNVPQALSQTRVFVLSSDHEGMPNALIEALSCGCACISTNCDFGPAELIKNRQNGLLVKTGSVEEMVRSLHELLSDDEFAISIAEKAKETRMKLSKEKICNLYKEFFEKVVAENRFR